MHAMSSISESSSMTGSKYSFAKLQINDPNYQSWRRNVTLQLSEDESDIFLSQDMSLMQEDTEEKKKLKTHMLTKAKKTMNVVWFALSPELQNAYGHHENVLSLWKALQTAFESKSALHAETVSIKLATLRMSSNEAFDTFYCKYMNLHTQLRNCGVTITDDEFKNKLLRCLPSEYDTVVKAIQIQPENFSLEKVCSIIRNEQELQIVKGMSNISLNEVVNQASNEALHYNVSNRGRGRGAYGNVNRGGTNNFYNRTTDDYYNKNSSNGNTTTAQHQSNNMHTGYNASYSPMLCHQCNAPGHIKFDCPQNQGKPKCEYCRTIGSHSTNDCRSKN
jgi:hypothetical protein